MLRGYSNNSVLANTDNQVNEFITIFRDLCHLPGLITGTNIDHTRTVKKNNTTVTDYQRKTTLILA
jgi:hypothetical protein